MSSSLSAAGRLRPPFSLPRALADRAFARGTSSASDVAGVSGSSTTDSGLELTTGDTLERGVVCADNAAMLRAD